MGRNLPKPAPPPYNDCWPSRYGSRRSYNGSAYIYFHTGLDFCGGVGTEILAPAPGRVVFAGPLTVRATPPSSIMVGVSTRLICTNPKSWSSQAIW